MTANQPTPPTALINNEAPLEIINVPLSSPEKINIHLKGP